MENFTAKEKSGGGPKKRYLEMTLASPASRY